jgi:hypothetical protein
MTVYDRRDQEATDACNRYAAEQVGQQDKRRRAGRGPHVAPLSRAHAFARSIQTL